MVGEPEELHGGVHVSLFSESECNPAAAGQDVVRLRPSFLDEPVPDVHREYDVSLEVAVDVAELAPAHPELGASEPVGAHDDPLPPGDLARYPRVGASDGHLSGFRGKTLIFVEIGFRSQMARIPRPRKKGVLWDLASKNVIDAKRIRNPAKFGFVKHEAEKDPIEFIQIIKALSRPGDFIGDFFCGVAKWVKEALRLGRHVMVSDVEKMDQCSRGRPRSITLKKKRFNC